MNRFISLLSVLVLLPACGDPDDATRVVGELASDRIELVAESNEPIVEILVQEGTEVAAGQVLVRQDATRATTRLAEADAALRQAEARLAELVRGPRAEQIEAARANLFGAEQELVFLRADFERIKTIAEQELVSEGALDRARAAQDGGVAAVELRRAELEERLTGTTLEELEQAEAAVDQASARRDAARIDLDRHTLRAPADGLADTRLFEIGERPSSGQPVMIMLGGKQAFARVFVPEHLRVHVSPGTRADIYVDGIAEPLEGRVRWVASEAAFTPYFALTERDRGRLSFTAKVDIVDDVDRLPDGIPLEVDLHLPDVTP